MSDAVKHRHRYPMAQTTTTRAYRIVVRDFRDPCNCRRSLTHFGKFKRGKLRPGLLVVVHLVQVLGNDSNQLLKAKPTERKVSRR